MGEKIMAVHVELQTERRPCGDIQAAEPKLLINKVKVIMEAFALVKLKECSACCLIMLWLIGIALLHGGKDVDQPLRFSGLLDDLLDAVSFTESLEQLPFENTDTISCIRKALLYSIY